MKDEASSNNLKFFYNFSFKINKINFAKDNLQITNSKSGQTRI